MYGRLTICMITRLHIQIIKCKASQIFISMEKYWNLWYKYNKVDGVIYYSQKKYRFEKSSKKKLPF